MTKVVINRCNGGFALSSEATEMMGGAKTFQRDDPRLVLAVETLGSSANGRYSDLVIVEIPDDVEWQIEEFDGREWVAEKHRIWEA